MLLPAELIAQEPLEKLSENDASWLASNLDFDPNETLIALTPEIRQQLNPNERFSLGIDRLEREQFLSVRGKKVLLATNRIAFDSNGRHSLELFINSPEPELKTVILFNDELPAPGHGPLVDRLISTHSWLRVIERTPGNPSPQASILDDIDILVIDLPIRGPRYAPEVAFLGSMLIRASERDIPVLLLDRPLPLSGLNTEGPVGNLLDTKTIANFFPTPALPGMTPGELAILFNTYYGIGARLEVLEMLDWKRTQGTQPFIERIASNRPNLPGEYSEWDAYFSTDRRWQEWTAVAAMAPEHAVVEVLRGTEDTPARLVLDPSPLPAENFCRTFQRMIGNAITCTVPEGPDARVVLQTQDPLAPVTISTAIWAILGQETPELLDQPIDRIGNPAIYEAIEKGRSPLELRRMWEQAPAYEEFLRNRTKSLRYGL